MGFERPAWPVRRMEFEDGPYAGLVLVFRAAPMSTIAAADRAFAAYEAAARATPQLISAMRPLADELGQLLIAWNLEEGGRPVPVGRFMSEPSLFTFKVAERFMLELFEVPLAGAQPAPEQAESPVAAVDEADLPMEPLPLPEAV